MISGAPVIRRPFVRWGLLALIQLALIAVPLADRLEVQFGGEEVILDLRPVDPRDLLRGDYVIVNLALTQVSREVPGTSGDFAEGEIIYAGLERKEDGAANVVKISRTRGDAGPVAMKGRIESVSFDTLSIDYDIDAFFLPEGEGLEIERLPAERVQIVVAIHPDGRSLPLRLLVDGKVFKSDEVL
jgi:uncharacterized membrane-anchored protein